jgi:hypothetical protein
VKSRLFLSSLVLVGLALVAPHLGDAATQLDPARIVVRADRTLAPVSPLLFGQNHGPWMNTTAGYVADYREAGVTLLRFPAGNWGDENDLFPNNVDDLAMLADALDAQVSVQARSWRKGTPEKAAELVRYSNVENDYDFRYWEVGNEPDLYVNRRNRSGDPMFDADWYNASFREFATAMKAVDPDIQIVGPVVTGGWREWMPAFIAANGDVVDVISWHWYAHWGTTQVDAGSSDEALLPAFASLHDDGQLAILVVNKDPLEAREATLTVEGFRPAGQARVWLQDEEHLAEELPAIVVAEMFPHTFPPYSVTLFILEPVPRGRWLLWAGLGLLALALVTLGVLMPRLRRSR